MEAIEQKLKVVIMMGLPGSGKTYYSSHYKGETINVIHFDDYKDEYDSIYDVLWVKMRDNTKYIYSLDKITNTLVLDGPFFTVSAVSSLIHRLAECLSDEYETDCHYIKIRYILDKIEIVVFSEDREACMCNDRYRRAQNSAITIQHAPFDADVTAQNFDSIKQVYCLSDITVTNVKTERHSAWDTAFVPYIRRNDDGVDYLTSEEWTVGGTWHDCYGNEGKVEAEPAREFTEFDEMLLKLCPDVSYLRYLELKRNCIEVIEDTSSDYYTSTNYMYWRCNLKKLYNMMLEMHLIDEYPNDERSI